MIAIHYLVVIATIISAQSVLSAKKVHLDVYYESQCPDSYFFFLRQLRPVSEELDGYVETNLVPYGNAHTTREGGKVTFSCQHGVSECLLNKIHACALARLHQGSNLERVRLASCLFKYFKRPELAGKTCSPKYGLKWNEVLSCAKGLKGIELEYRHGKETHSLNPPPRFIPTIAINKYRGDDDFQNEIRTDLKKVICKTLAKERITPYACYR
uniref:Gamma-interferon-inducible lysosomal thiol reductase n=1 Tax=Lygus hesperus TaxID=30085 RepID=A0A0A9WCG8_LYGHE